MAGIKRVLGLQLGILSYICQTPHLSNQNMAAPQTHYRRLTLILSSLERKQKRIEIFVLYILILFDI